MQQTDALSAALECPSPFTLERRVDGEPALEHTPITDLGVGEEGGMMTTASPASRDNAGDALHPELLAGLAGFKKYAASLDRALDKGDAALTIECRHRLLQAFESICARTNDGAAAGGGAIEFIRQELLPYVLLGRGSERAYSKPLGYGGDYLTIDLIYQNEPAGAGRIGPAVDAMFLAQPAARAVRHRRALMASEIAREISRHEGRAVHVTSLGCGPAREVFDVLGDADARARLTMTLVDMDANALEHVRVGLTAEGLQRRVSLVEANVLDLAWKRQRLNLPPQDLIYSIGLVDYLRDGQAVRVLNLVHSMLRPGGRIVIGNFHPRNPSRGLMEQVLDWKLIHRSEADMDRLFQRSAFEAPSSRIVFEQEGINLFAECVKAERR